MSYEVPLPSKITRRAGAASEAIDEMVGIYYRPKTQDTRQTFEYLLSFIMEALGDQPRDVLCGAADEVLAALKNERLRDKERRREVSTLLGTLADERYALLVNLGKKITDWVPPERALQQQREVQETAEAVGEQADEYGVNVQFEESDDEAETPADGAAGAKTKSSVGELDAFGEVMEMEEEAEGEEADIDTVLQSRTGGAVPEDTHTVKTPVALHPRDVDAHWLQRQLAHHIKEPTVAQAKATEIFEILKVVPLLSVNTLILIRKLAALAILSFSSITFHSIYHCAYVT